VAPSRWFKNRSNELIVPAGTKTDPKAQEVLRAWVADGNLHVSLRVETWNDPTAWGVVLADLAKHVAKAYGLHKHLDEVQALERIKAVMDAELPSPTQPSGRLIT